MFDLLSPRQSQQGHEELAALYDQLEFELVWVTPEMATNWLRPEINRHNRRLSWTKVYDYVNDMNTGRWLFAGDPVRFSRLGELMDGQHRLTAIALGDKGWPCLVIRGLDPEAQKVMDIGKKRSADDALKFLNFEGDLRDIAAISRGLLMYENGEKPTQMQVVEFAEQNFTELSEGASVMRRTTKSEGGRIAGGSLWGVAHVLLSRIDAEAARDFFEKVCTGANLTTNDPILRLRNVFIKGMPVTSRDASAIRTNLRWIFKAWNLSRQNRPSVVFGVRRGEQITPL